VNPLKSLSSMRASDSDASDLTQARVETLWCL
jgi:hypothetical protein